MECPKPHETPETPENKKKINISILQGSKLFNENTPFIININSPDTMIKKSNVDLICIIDISGSMKAQKLSLVKESLKSLISLMDSNDRMALILFNDKASRYLGLSYLSKETKADYKAKIDKIKSKGGTNILSGLEEAVNILKEEKLKEANKISNEENEDNVRVTSLMLLSDGNDNDYNDIEIADGLKKLTKGHNLTFTLHTIGYGEDHDPKIMSRLANLRDGSFYMIEELDKVQDCFVNILGGCMSVMYNEATLKVKALKDNIKIKKIYGMNKLYKYELKDNCFETTILQFISGKEYTFTIEVELPSIISINDDILEAEFTGETNLADNKQICKYKIVGGAFSVADEEYLRCKLYDTIDRALELKEQKKDEEMKKILNEMKTWIKDNYEGINKSKYLKKIDETLGLIEDNNLFEFKGRSRVTADINENYLKRGGINLNYSNHYQQMMINQCKACSQPMYRK
jgi:Mg-chelatase subunit ChlD